MTNLLTCWIPLNPCGVDSPGLEFALRRQPALLHFSELDDWVLRQRFLPEDSWRHRSKSVMVWFSSTAPFTGPTQVRKCTRTG
jgi:hypothetical protein